MSRVSAGEWAERRRPCGERRGWPDESRSHDVSTELRDLYRPEGGRAEVAQPPWLVGVGVTTVAVTVVTPAET
jgi:hypothetical protein